MKKVQKKGILDLVMDGNKISEKETDWSEAVDSRQLQSGNWTEQASVLWNGCYFICTVRDIFSM